MNISTSKHFPHFIFLFVCVSLFSSPRIFLGILGCGLSILFCTTFCKVCSRLRVQHLERETWRRSEQDGQPPSIYFIPIAGSVSQQDDDSHLGVPRYSQEFHTPPQYSTTAYCGPPPSYNEV